jgi:uncharacterized protein
MPGYGFCRLLLNTIIHKQIGGFMKLSGEEFLLRIFIGESDKYKLNPLYEAIVLKARELKLAGATVLKGTMGFGANSHLHTNKVLRLSEDLPIIIEIVDSMENIDKLLPFLDENVEEGLITIEKVRIIKYLSKKKG